MSGSKLSTVHSRYDASLDINLDTSNWVGSMSLILHISREDTRFTEKLSWLLLQKIAEYGNWLMRFECSKIFENLWKIRQLQLKTALHCTSPHLARPRWNPCRRFWPWLRRRSLPCWLHDSHCENVTITEGRWPYIPVAKESNDSLFLQFPRYPYTSERKNFFLPGARIKLRSLAVQHLNHYAT